MNSWVCGKMQNAVERCIVTVSVATASRSRRSCRSTTMTSFLEESRLPNQRTPKPWLRMIKHSFHSSFPHLHSSRSLHSHTFHFCHLAEVRPSTAEIAFSTPQVSCRGPNAPLPPRQAGKHPLTLLLVSSMLISRLPVKLEKQVGVGRPLRSSCQSAITSCKSSRGRLGQEGKIIIVISTEHSR